MGYNTRYKGELHIEATIAGLKRLKSILGSDVRDNKDFAKYKGSHDPKDSYWHHVDLVLNDDFNLEWDDDAEKSYVCPDMIATIISYVREVDPTFSITGKLDAYGEEAGDVWQLVCTKQRIYRVSPEEERKRTEALFKELLDAVEATLHFHGIVNIHCPPPEFVRLGLAARALQESL